MLELHNKSVFEHSLESFKKYFRTHYFIFVARNINNTFKFIQKSLIKLGIENTEIVLLNKLTSGQASTAFQGIQHSVRRKHLLGSKLTIFNIDTFRPNFVFPSCIMSNADGYLEVFIGEGVNWSFAKIDKTDKTKVVETAEKEPISNLCSTGLYHFKTAELFVKGYSSNSFRQEKGEDYIAPLYNTLIQQGQIIRIHLIEKKDVIFCGTPEEYLKLK